MSVGVVHVELARLVKDPAFEEYATRNEVNWFGKDKARVEFGEQVTAYVRNRDPFVEFDPAVVKAGNAQRAELVGWAEHLRNPGILDGGVYRPVKGADLLESDKNYAPRIPDVRSVDEKLSKYGSKQMEALVEHAMRSVQGDLDDVIGKRIAKGYMKKLQSVAYGQETTVGRALGGDDLDELKRILLEDGDLDEVTLDTVLNGLAKPAKDGAKPRLKSRLFVDENAGLKMRDQKTGEVAFVRFSDLLNNDADQLMQGYNRFASGQVALARVKVKDPRWKDGDEGDGFLIDGISSRGEYETLMSQVAAIGEQSGVDRAVTAAELRRLRFAHDVISGVPNPREGTNFGQALRMLRDYNFIRVMNQVGFAQIPELLSIGGQLGMKAMYQGMPPLRALIRNARTGAIDDALSDELELLTGTGTDWLRGASNTRWDDFGNPMTLAGNSPVLIGADNVMRKGKRVTSAISGMAPINTLLQRWVSRAMAAKMANLAHDPAGISMARIRSLGIADDMLPRISEQLKTHGSFMKGELSGKNLRQLNVETWGDQEAAAVFRQAMFRGARRIIQENDVGNMAQWMSEPLAKNLLQFRTFVIGSWTKTLLHNVHMNDFATYATFMGSLFAGGLTYIAQTHINMATVEDRDAQLAKRLSIGAISRGALQRSSWFSLFGPAIDTGALFAGAEPVFDARTTALSSDIIFGNPTVDLFTGLAKGTGSLVQGALTGEGTQAGVKNVMRPLPFQNFMPFVGLTNALITGMSKYDGQ